MGIWILPVLVAILFLAAFWGEFWQFMAFWYFVAAEVFDFQKVWPVSYEMLRGVAVILFNACLGFLPVFIIGLFLVSAQAILPVNSLKDVYRTAWHLVLHILHSHGPALFIRDGHLMEMPEDRRKHGPGIVGIDFNSAAVLESRLLPPGINSFLFDLVDGLFIRLGLYDPRQSPRVCGPGIIFTRRRERIRAAVDLRKQIRFEKGVEAYTRDGIKVSANIWSKFSIGEEPEVIQVAYIGERRAENLRVIHLAPAVGAGRCRITAIVDDLDNADRREIHHFARTAERLSQVKAYAHLSKPDSRPTFDPQRVFAAVFSQARDDHNEMLPWLSLPNRVATDLFREIISKVNFDDLYAADGTGEFALAGIKDQLRKAMVALGLLSYRVIIPSNQQPLIEATEYEEADLRTTNIQLLRASKVLRDRGIKVISAGFGDLSAADHVFQQRLEAWRASWQRDTDIVRGRFEHEAMNIRSAAQAQAQQDLYDAFSRVYQDTALSREAIAIHAFQALERAAADPATRAMLSTPTIQIMQSLHHLILPEDYEPPQEQ